MHPFLARNIILPQKGYTKITGLTLAGVRKNGLNLPIQIGVASITLVTVKVSLFLTPLTVR